MKSSLCSSPNSNRPFRSAPRPAIPLLRLTFSPLLLFTFFLSACATLPPTSAATSTPSPTATFLPPVTLPPTWTPAPPTPTSPPPTLRPTGTPFPTDTPAPPLPPTPTTFPPVRLASPDSHPLPFFSLLFLQAGVVREWGPDGEVRDLVTLAGANDRLDRVQLFDPSGGGALVAILHRSASGQSEIVLYDRAARAIRWTHTVAADNPADLEISPDGFWVAYAGNGSATVPHTVILLPIAAPDQPVSLGTCGPKCTGLLFSPGGERFLWSDESGLWRVDPLLGANQTPERILEPYLESLSASGQATTGAYTPLAWSPSGRFLLMLRGASSESLPVVFDTQTQRVAEVPGPFLYADPGLNVAWLAEDRLAVTRAGLAAGESGRPAIQILQVVPETGSFFIEAGAVAVGNAAAQAPFAPIQLFDGGIRFALLDFSSPAYRPGNGIYVYDPASGSLTRLNDLPFLRVSRALWTPDGTAVLLLTARKAFYVPTNGASIYEMDAYLGVNACCFAWVP